MLPGFLAAFREAGALHPLVAATLGAILTTWVTFVPYFLWTSRQFGAVGRADRHHRGGGGRDPEPRHLVRDPQPVRAGPPSRGVDLPVLSSVNVPPLILSVAAMVAMFRFRAGVLPVLLVGALAGAAYVLLS